MSRSIALAIVVAVAFACGACTFTRCTTWLLDPHVLSPSAPSQQANVQKCEGK